MSRQLLTALPLILAFTIPSIVSGESDVPKFDPQTPTDLDKYDGGEWPDENEVNEAFERQYGQFDGCVLAEKERAGITARFEGEAGMAVLLDPAGNRPKGVNAHFPENYERRSELVRCLRNATAGAAYPTYDGPPLVVEFEFEIDPGDELIEED